MTKPEKDKKELMDVLQTEQKRVAEMRFKPFPFEPSQKFPSDTLDFGHLKNYSFPRGGHDDNYVTTEYERAKHFKEGLAKAGYSFQEWPLEAGREGEEYTGYLNIFDSEGKNVGAFRQNSVKSSDKWVDFAIVHVVADDPKLEETLQNIGLKPRPRRQRDVYVKGTSIAQLMTDQFDATQRQIAEKERNEKCGHYITR